jgi:hypothetical protein
MQIEIQRPAALAYAGPSGGGYVTYVTARGRKGSHASITFSSQFSPSKTVPELRRRRFGRTNETVWLSCGSLYSEAYVYSRVVVNMFLGERLFFFLYRIACVYHFSSRLLDHMPPLRSLISSRVRNVGVSAPCFALPGAPKPPWIKTSDRQSS